jgi:hypothetical protein
LAGARNETQSNQIGAVSDGHSTPMNRLSLMMANIWCTNPGTVCHRQPATGMEPVRITVLLSVCNPPEAAVP